MFNVCRNSDTKNFLKCVNRLLVVWKKGGISSNFTEKTLIRKCVLKLMTGECKCRNGQGFAAELIRKSSFTFWNFFKKQYDTIIWMCSLFNISDNYIIIIIILLRMAGVLVGSRCCLKGWSSYVLSMDCLTLPVT